MGRLRRRRPARPGSVESGQLVLNKRTCWRPINLAWFYNDHSDYYYRYCYGDKHTFEVAWWCCGVPFVMWNAEARWAEVAFLHSGPDGRPLFVHRCADKFRFDRQKYVTHQNYEAPYFHSFLPLDANAGDGWPTWPDPSVARLNCPLFPEDRDDRPARMPLA